MSVEITTVRFNLRELHVEDATEQYLGWLTDAAALRHIAAAATTNNMAALRRYVLDRVGRVDVLFLGIFERYTGRHIGNIKFEPVNSQQGYAIMGILVGDPDYRGKGVAPEVLSACGQWLKTHRGIRQILLGVSVDNHRALRAYEAAGFQLEDSPHMPNHPPGCITMILPL